MVDKKPSSPFKIGASKADIRNAPARKRLYKFSPRLIRSKNILNLLLSLISLVLLLNLSNLYEIFTMATVAFSAILEYCTKRKQFLFLYSENSFSTNN